MEKSVRTDENLEKCSHCRSPWRICRACAEQEDHKRLPFKEIRVWNGHGLCKFHTESGAEARRNGSSSNLSPAAEEELKRKMLENLGMRIELVSVDEVIPFEGQPRIYFNLDDLKSLSKSMKKKGQHIPIIVVELSPPVNGCKFELVDGERRWRSARMNGEKYLLALVTKVANKEEQFVKATIANLSRSGHTPWEEARAIKRIMSYLDCTVAEVSDILGFSSQTGYNRMKLLDLHDDVQKYLQVAESPINATVAVKVQKLIPMDEQPRVAKAIVQKKMDTASAILLIESEARSLGQRIPKKKRTAKDRLSMIKSFLNATERGAFRLLGFSSEDMKGAIKLLRMSQHQELKRQMKEIKKCFEKLDVRI